jgi:hypothetical protein
MISDLRIDPTSVYFLAAPSIRFEGTNDHWGFVSGGNGEDALEQAGRVGGG